MSPLLIHRILPLIRPRALIALLILLSAGGAEELQAQPWTMSYFRGMQALKNKNWDEAILQLSSAIDARPSSQAGVHVVGRQYVDYFPYLYRGIAYYQNNEREKARTDIEHEDELGEVPRGNRDTRAAELLKQFLPLVKDQKRQGPFAEGMRLFNGKDYRGAIEKFAHVPATSPRYDEARNFITLAQEEIRKSDEAAASAKAPKARRVASVRPATSGVDTSDQSLYREAVALYNAGKLRGARKKFQELRIKGFASPDIERYLLDIATLEEKILMGVTAYLEGDYPLAVSQLGECARTESDNPHLYAFLAYSCAAGYLITGRQDASLSRQARDAYSRLLTVAPSYVPNVRFVSPGVISFLKGE